jgi:hypothetical protein
MPLKNGSIETIAATGTASSGRQAFQKILVGLEKTVAEGKWNTAETMKFPELQTRKKEQLIFVSDFLQVQNEWLSLVKSLASPHREIVIFQILGDQEVNFNLEGFYRFKDLETGSEIELDAASVREKFREAADEYLQKLKEELQIPHVHLIRAQLGDPVGMVLKTFLTKRKG